MTNRHQRSPTRRSSAISGTMSDLRYRLHPSTHPQTTYEPTRCLDNQQATKQLMTLFLLNDFEYVATPSHFRFAATANSNSLRSANVVRA